MKLTIENGRFMLRFNYDATLISQIKELNCGQFEKVYKAWSFPLTGVAYRKLKTLGLSHPDVEAWLKRRKTVRLSDHQYKTEPMAHQIEALRKVLHHFNIEVQ